MRWVLVEIVVPLIAAFGLGLLVGWLLWRWRRRLIAPSEWYQHTADAEQARRDAAAATAAREELVSERALLADRIGELSAELERTRRRLDEGRPPRADEDERPD